MKTYKGFEALQYIINNKNKKLYYYNDNNKLVLYFNKRKDKLSLLYNGSDCQLRINDSNLEIAWTDKETCRYYFKVYINNKLLKVMTQLNNNEPLNTTTDALYNKYKREYPLEDVEIKYEEMI